MDLVHEVRQFNRFYTRLIGLLDEHLPDTGLSLPEGRVLYELATGGEQTAADLVRTLDIDKAQLSRVIRRLRERRLVGSEVDPAHAKKRILSLTPAGRAAFAELDQGTRSRMTSVLGPLDAAKRHRVAASLREVQAAFGACAGESAPITLRRPVAGDLGWVIHRQAALYAREYGWDLTYEALISKVLGTFAANFDASREDGWIAERAGQVVGSIFLMKSDDAAIAKLRLLYVEPDARGSGLGQRLVDTCIERARQLGYRRLSLWTNDVLMAARRIYEAAGFRLTKEYAHRSFGHDLTGQVWELDLSPTAVQAEVASPAGSARTPTTKAPEILLRQADSPERIAIARQLFGEYAEAIGTDLEYQGFSAELAGLPAPYAPPRGALLIAFVGADVAGCVAMRPLDGETAEMKRLYVRSGYRGLSLGKQLVEAVIEAARQAGYRELRLDTLSSMVSAQALYRRLGFVEIPPYNSTHLPGTRFYALRLAAQ